jgi:hypothetical protein
MVIHTRCDARDKQCGGTVWQASLAFGVVQLFFSQMPTLESAWWASMVGATMSVLYSTAALGMGAVRGALKVPWPPARGRDSLFGGWAGGLIAVA